MAAVLVYTAENMIESFLEPVLDLLAALIEFDRDALAAGAPGELPAPAVAPPPGTCNAPGCWSAQQLRSLFANPSLHADAHLH